MPETGAKNTRTRPNSGEFGYPNPPKLIVKGTPSNSKARAETGVMAFAFPVDPASASYLENPAGRDRYPAGRSASMRSRAENGLPLHLPESETPQLSQMG